MTPLLMIAALFGGPTDAQAAQVVNAIKKAERAGFERHQLPAYLRAFTADAVWIEGRRSAPDVHDVRLSRAVKSELLRREYRLPPSPRDRVVFADPEIDRAATPPTVELTLKRRFFGGKDGIRRRYTLRRVEDRWRVARVRTWPVGQATGLDIVQFDDAFWTAADAAVDDPGTLDRAERLEALLTARRWVEAEALCRWITTQPGPTGDDFIKHGKVLLRLGRLAEAEAAAHKAKAVEPGLEPPQFLLP